MTALSLYLLRCRIPRRRTAPEIRFISQVARQRRVVAKNSVLRHWLPALDRLEEPPQMRLFLVPRYAFITEALHRRFLAWGRVVLLMPLLDISFPHLPRVAHSVVTRRGIFACLGQIVDCRLRHFQDALRALEPIHLRSFATQIEPHIYRHFSILK